MEKFGQDYASQIVKNSKKLAQSLKEEGLPVLYEDRNFTESHQVLLDYFPDYKKDLLKKLEMNNIITDNSGRIGTSEMTRYGMREAEMEQIASLIGDIFNNKLDVKSVKDIDKMRNDFSEVLFC